MTKFLSQTNAALIKKKRRWQPKGRQVNEQSIQEIIKLFANKKIIREELIEYLHIIQDTFGILHHTHLVALAEILKI